jgi:hypothetical protein
MPLTPLQRKILQAIAANRTPEPYVAGGSALNAQGGRFSSDIDIFNDSVDAVAIAASLDEGSLRGAGMTVDWKIRHGGFHRAIVEDGFAKTRLEWANESDYRFFPTQKDADFGYVLHPVDLATNKLLAAADRREVRDFVDLMRIEQDILPLGAVAWAAAQKSPGRSPEMIISELRRHARFRDEELEQERLAKRLPAADLNTWLRNACNRAEAWIGSIPPAFEFGVFVDRQGHVGAPDFAREPVEEWSIHKGSRGGVWPASPEISGEMLDRSTMPGKPNNGPSLDG